MRTGFDGITDFIFMDDPIEKADVILIPGGSHKQLIHKAVELYQLGYAQYILISGGFNKKIPEYESEYQFLSEEALRLGVPRDAILKENQAAHTFDNAEFSYNVLKNENFEVKKAILVCKSFHARRAYLTYKVYFPSDVQFIVQPILDGKDISRNNWYLSQDKITRVMNEVEKIGKYFESRMDKLESHKS